MAVSAVAPSLSDDHLGELVALTRDADSVERVQRKRGDSVVELRPVIPSELPKTLRKAEVREVASGARPLDDSARRSVEERSAT